jgi:hypothetical protein
VKYDGQEFKIFTTDDGLRNNFIIDINQTRNGDIVLATWGGGLQVIRNDKVIRVDIKNDAFENIDKTVKIYPNPTSSIINIESDFTINSIELYDMQGRNLETRQMNETRTAIDISTKSNGVYFLKIKTDHGSKVMKIIKN